MDGWLSSDDEAPSDRYVVSDPHEEQVPYQRRHTRQDLYYAFFETASATLGAQAQKELVTFVERASQRYVGAKAIGHWFVSDVRQARQRARRLRRPCDPSLGEGRAPATDRSHRP